MTQMWLCNPAKRLYFFRCRSLSLKGSCHEYFAVLQCRSISYDLKVITYCFYSYRKCSCTVKQALTAITFWVIFASIRVHLSIHSSRWQETVSVPIVFNNKTGPLFLNSIDVINFFTFEKDSKDRDITTLNRWTVIYMYQSQTCLSFVCQRRLSSVS